MDPIGEPAFLTGAIRSMAVSPQERASFADTLSVTKLVGPLRIC